jgi:thioredoxin-dependent peroxiredoxin
MMSERPAVITMNGKPLTLQGNELKVGNPAPDFEVIDNNLQPIHLKDFLEKVLIISTVPSLDTPVCDIETRRFNMEAEHLDKSIKILTISMDLPFAQKRWCGAAGIDRVLTLSDYRTGAFGLTYGVLIKELKLLARAVFVLDKDRITRHIQIVKEITEQPDYSAALKAAKRFV